MNTVDKDNKTLNDGCEKCRCIGCDCKPCCCTFCRCLRGAPLETQFYEDLEKWEDWERSELKICDIKED